MRVKWNLAPCSARKSARFALLGCLQVVAALLVEVVAGVAHGVGPAAAEHHLEIDRREAVVLEAVDHAGRARDAFPRPEPRGEALAVLVLDDHVENALQHAEALLDLVGGLGVALPGRASE